MRLKTDDGSGEVVFHPSGRFDAYEAPKFRDQFAGALGSDASRIVVDLANIMFIDSTALAELVRAHRESSAKGIEFRLSSPSGPAKVILDVTGLGSFFTIDA